MIVDAHIHLVSRDERAYPLNPSDLSGPWYRKAPLPAEELLEQMGPAGVDRAIAVQPLGAYTYDNRYAVDSAQRHPERLVAVCCVDCRADDAPARLEHWVRERGARGVRVFALPQLGAPALDDARSLRVCERAAELDVPIVVTILGDQLAQLRRLLERLREPPVLLDHCGFPRLTGAPWERDAAELMALAEFPNLHLKVSTTVLDEAARAGDPAQFVRALATRFGARRLLWGSDYPQTHDRSYPELAAFGRSAFSALRADDRAWALGGTALCLWPELE
jgi:predicted TIM-barrel fold metal-dependent hydrolase